MKIRSWKAVYLVSRVKITCHVALLRSCLRSETRSKPFFGSRQVESVTTYPFSCPQVGRVSHDWLIVSSATAGVRELVFSEG
jgi:hypothetical protein